LREGAGGQVEMRRVFQDDFSAALETLRDSNLRGLYPEAYLQRAQAESGGRVQDAWRASTVIFAAEVARFTLPLAPRVGDEGQSRKEVSS
jgi:hypothetical protein